MDVAHFFGRIKVNSTVALQFNQGKGTIKGSPSLFKRRVHPPDHETVHVLTQNFQQFDGIPERLQKSISAYASSLLDISNDRCLDVFPGGGP